MAQIQITDFEKWGNLIKSWATGENRLGDGHKYALPKTPQELKEQMARAGVGGRVSDEVKSIQFITQDSETLVIVLPPGEAIRKAERDLDNGQPYPLPIFYKLAFGGADVKVDWKTFNAQRLGEYVINNCL
jgi:hypothetical protein